MSSAYIAYLNTIVAGWQNFLYYFRPILCALCLTGNCFDVIIFSRPRFRTVSCCTYFLAAAITIVIQFGISSILVFYAYDHTDPITSILGVCKFYLYLQQSTAMIQRWLMSAATFDRYASSSGRPALRRLATVHVARRIVMGIVLIWLIIPIYRIIFSSIKSKTCGILDNDVAALIQSIYAAVAAVIIPLAVMVPSFIFIQQNLAHRRKLRLHVVMSYREGKNQRTEFERKRDQQVLIILLVQVIVYFILITPVMAVQIYNAVTLTTPNKSPDRLIIEQLIFNVSEITGTIYSSIPAFLNTMVSRMFRDEFMIIVRNVFFCKRLFNTNRVQPILMLPRVKTHLPQSLYIQAPLSKQLVVKSNISENIIQTVPKQAITDQNLTQ